MVSQYQKKSNSLLHILSQRILIENKIFAEIWSFTHVNYDATICVAMRCVCLFTKNRYSLSMFFDKICNQAISQQVTSVAAMAAPGRAGLSSGGVVP